MVSNVWLLAALVTMIGLAYVTVPMQPHLTCLLRSTSPLCLRNTHRMGFLDTGGNVSIIWLHGDNVGPYLQGSVFLLPLWPMELRKMQRFVKRRRLSRSDALQLRLGRICGAHDRRLVHRRTRRRPHLVRTLGLPQLSLISVHQGALVLTRPTTGRLNIGPSGRSA